ncbi:MAG: hypothetical protein J5780_04510, partial [Treponema sp.]|nr:hypothetical protein [Treponema sp.]
MMMKKYILSLTLALAALAFTGCSDVWTGEGFAGSTSDFSCAESTATASTGTGASGYETARYATFKIGSSDYFSSGAYASNLAVISQAAPDTEITLTINSYTRLNKDSV